MEKKTNNKTVYNFAYLNNEPLFFKGSVSKRILRCLKLLIKNY